MRAISEQRRLVETEGHKHSVKRGFRWKLHFENLPWLVKVLKFLLKVNFLRWIGEKNAAYIKTEEVQIGFDELPGAFDNTRILLITDLHIDGIEGLAERIAETAERLDYDFCVLGGDYSFGHGKNCGRACERMKHLAERLIKKTRVFAVLGNHDRYRMAQVLDECGVEVLLNENVCLEKGKDKIHLAGLDDCHYYGADDIALADEGIRAEVFKIMVCHSPERYRQAAKAGYALYLAGHTHGGQICLPTGAIVVTGTTAPRYVLKGRWNYKKMVGYTSRGAGTSGVNVRYFCPPEMTVITLKNNGKID